MVRALFAGSFNPFHEGHLLVVKKALRIFDYLYVVVSYNHHKQATRKISFYDNVETQVQVIKKKCQEYKSKVKIMVNNNDLTVVFAKKLGVSILVRGVRNVKDFKYEQKLMIVNKIIAPEIETVFFCSWNSQQLKVGHRWKKEFSFFQQKSSFDPKKF